jgi:superfamily II RNA helicase
MNQNIHYGILFCSKKERVQKTGVLFVDAFGHNELIVHTKIVGFVDMWAKVVDGKLCEVYGKCGNERTEEHVLRTKYGIKAFQNQPRLSEDRAVARQGRLVGCASIHRAYTIDTIGTRFADDAITLLVIDDVTARVGIHVVDCTDLWNDELTEDSHRRCMTIYWKQISDTVPDNCFHMLHPSVLESSCLAVHKTHSCITVWCTIRNGVVIDEFHEKTAVHITQALDYHSFDSYLKDKSTSATSCAYATAFGGRCASDAVQWCMVRYSEYMQRIVVSSSSVAQMREKPLVTQVFDETLELDKQLETQVLNRTLDTQELDKPLETQVLEKTEPETEHGPIFYNVSDRLYASTTVDGRKSIMQFTSPLRRFVDAYNQCLAMAVPMHTNRSWKPDVRALSLRMSDIKDFQVKHRTLRLAIGCRNVPMLLRMTTHHSNVMLLHVFDSKGARYTVSKHDSFISTEKIVDESCTLVWGVLRRGRSVLKAQEMNEATLTQPTTRLSKKPTQSDVETPQRLSDILTVAEYIRKIEDLYGYPLDDFQSQCAHVIYRGDDLLGMAPTGSGKTTVAMMGIIAAFLMGKKVVYTSPIKALSNEKYMEMQKLCEGGRVSIVTGDIKHRSMPCGTDDSELLIMTAEIFRNKLSLNTELEHIGVVIQDEVHYISDAERGCVWEETIMLTPKHIQIISLSATIDEPDVFCRWLSTRRPTCLVQNTHRHVPLHVGAWDGREFKRLYTTNQAGGVGSMLNLKTHTTPAIMVEYLKENDQLPAIFFCMSKARCMTHAHSIQNNACIGSRPVKQKDQHDDEFADLLLVHSHDVREWRNQFDAVYRMYIQPYHSTLEKLDGFHEFVQMLELGVAYHHSGMIPILREWVEILFRKKIVRVVFATETLGVGINMPSRTVVFTQLEKPCGSGSSGHVEYRSFTNDEFWQMAGRAGRRGMDTQGFVMYAPTTSHISKSCTLTGMIRGKHQRASSQLAVTNMFVLRNVHKGASVLLGSLLQYEISQQQNALERESKQASSPAWTEDQRVLLIESEQIQSMLSDLIKPSIKKQRQMVNTLRANITALGGDAVWQEYIDKKRQQQSIVDHSQYLTSKWEQTIQILTAHDFLNPDRTYSKKGLACICMSDETAIIRTCVLFDGQLASLSFAELVAWMAGFVEIDSGIDEPTHVTLPDALSKAFTATNSMCEYFEMPICNWTTIAVMFEWCTNANIHSVVQLVGFARFGSFVKMVLRVSSLLDEWCTMLLGIEDFAMFNLLDGYNERLFSSIVSPKSLYVDVS